MRFEFLKRTSICVLCFSPLKNCVALFFRNELYSKHTSPFSLPPMNPPPPIPPMILSLLGAGASLVSGLLTTVFLGVSVSVKQKQNQDNKTRRSKTLQHLENITKMESLLNNKYLYVCASDDYSF